MTVVLLAAGCATTADEARRPQPLSPPPQLPAAPAPAVPSPPPEPPAAYQPLPFPIPIPADSYADEPIVEFGTIQIPRIGLAHTMFSGVTLHNIDRGPSHWPGTALPGQRGNAVVAGHRATHSQPFLRVHELAPGDEVIFGVGGVRSVYRVTGSLIVFPEDMWIANQTMAHTATLYACHPPGSEQQRYVVRMELVSTGPE